MTCPSRLRAKEIKTDECGRAKTFSLFSIARPHMRAFHASWFCFFLAFTSWFGIQPLLPSIIKEFKLSKRDVGNSGVASVAATIVFRIFVGPLCDKFGPRRIMATLLLTGSIPMALAGCISNGTGLILIRLFIGILGASFVPCQFWTSVMFNAKIVGSANALVGGWGNLGGGFTFLLMPAIFQLIKLLGAHEFLAWKLAVIAPSIICCVTGISILFTTDDSPQGDWRKRIIPKNYEVEDIEEEGGQILSDNQQNGTQKYSEEKQSKARTILTFIILIIQYGTCFGVEIATNTVINLYLLYKFKVDGCNETTMENSTDAVSIVHNEFSCSILDQDSASLIASLFGLMNIFARALGGGFSDILFKRFSISGRLLAHHICLAGEGIMLIIFSRMTSIPTAIIFLIITSLFVQSSEGTTYSIVPSVNKKRVGVIAGFVGAGGNTGAIIWNTIWIQLIEHDPSWWFWILGVIVISASVLTCFISVEGKTIFHVCQKSVK